MSGFDERAEGAATRRRRDEEGGSKGPSRADRNAVRNALGTGHRKLENDLSSLEVLLHANPENPNAPVEQGPPVPGDPSYNLAVQFFEKVFEDLDKIAQATLRIKLDDKRDLQTIVNGVDNLADAWNARRIAFATTNPTKSAASYKLAQKKEKEAEPFRELLERYFPGAGEEEES